MLGTPECNLLKVETRVFFRTGLPHGRVTSTWAHDMFHTSMLMCETLS